ncbi:right-handed parallel beta-helix repeat-containing protein [bacterium]|nr:right-handed parallel beta-helix repeat-containing protein [bacterium]
MHKKHICLILLTSLILFSALYSDTTYVSGHITAPSTTWDTAGSPYIITDDVYIDPSCTLRIEPGVDVLFRPNHSEPYSLFINGWLLAEGTETDTILFGCTTSGSSYYLWHSIFFLNPNDSISILEYCNIIYGRWCIVTAYGNQTIKNCLIQLYDDDYGPLVGVYCWNHTKTKIINNEFVNLVPPGEHGVNLEDYAEALIKHNKFIGSSDAVVTQDNTSALIDSNSFFNCKDGVGIFNDSSTSEIKIRWNVFEEIRSFGIRVYYSPAIVTINNNDIYEARSTGISIWGDETNHSASINNVLEKNGIDSMEYYGAFTVDSRVDSTIIKCNLFNDNYYDFPRYKPSGVKEITTTNFNGDSCDTFFNLFGYDPLFIDSTDFHLQEFSPCIDAGDPLLPWDPDSTRPDIGAFFFDQAPFVPEIIIKPEEYRLLQNYPNPFNSTTTIEYHLDLPYQKVKIEVYNLEGKLVKSLINGFKGKGNHKITWDGKDINGENVQSGLYLIKLDSNNKTVSTKTIFVK